MTLTLRKLVEEARREFDGGLNIDEAIRQAITNHADELCAKGCQLVVDIMPAKARKPTDLWFVTFPMPYVIANLAPYVQERLLKLPGVVTEIERRSKTHTDRDRFKFRPPT